MRGTITARAKNARDRMTLNSTNRAVCILEKAKAELRSLARATEKEIQTVGKAFEALTGHSNQIMQLAADLVASVEGESVTCVLPTVRRLGEAARCFIGRQLEASTGILHTVTAEAKLLGQISRATHEQAVIARKTKALSVLTNVEVARLGSQGGTFEHLAKQLADFSDSLSADIQRLTRDTDLHRRAVDSTRLDLFTELPRRRAAMAHIEAELATALTIAEAGIAQLSTAPPQFSRCLQDLKLQISGVVSAVQAQDIARQQIEHVEEAFTIICDRLVNGETAGPEGALEDAAWACAGLTIQIYQLAQVRDNVAGWSTQISQCMAGILRVSASDVVGLGPMVLAQEREISAQLAHFEVLEEHSHGYSQCIVETLEGIAKLMELVRAHLRKSKSIRDCLQLLTFNSIIEATHLGSQASAILAIARHIESISGEWRQITDQAEILMLELVKLVEPARQFMHVFSEESGREVAQAGLQTRASLESLRSTANFAAGQARRMREATEQMHREIVAVRASGEVLASCYERFEGVKIEVEQALCALAVGHANWKAEFDAPEVERVFSASYTIEMERRVLRAALCGAPLPVEEAKFSGNSAELF
jgi:hypothetical protein